MTSTFVSALGRLPATPASFSYNSYYSVVDSSARTDRDFHDKLTTTSSGTIVLKQPLPGQNGEQQGQKGSRRSQLPVSVQHNNSSGMLLGRSASIQSTQPISYMLTNLPRGLEYLAGLDRLFIRQKLPLVQVFLGCERKNEYEILDGHGHHVFNATEESGCLRRNCLGSARPFEMIIRDGHDDEVIHLSRPFALWPCQLQSISVYSTTCGNVFIGSVQEASICMPYYEVRDADGEVVVLIKVPPCPISCCCCSDVEFKILSKDRTVEVGRIAKRWSGMSREFFSDADNFGLCFPVDLDVKVKAVLLAACMLIDFMFFERGSSGSLIQKTCCCS